MREIYRFSSTQFWPLARNFIAFLSFSLVLLSIISAAYASTNSTSYQFWIAVKGESRYFDGSNISFNSPNADSTPFIHPSNYTYSVALYRDTFIDDYIGTVTLYRDESGTASWSNVGSGHYYVYLNKSNDGVTLVDNNVTIKNY